MRDADDVATGLAASAAGPVFVPCPDLGVLRIVGPDRVEAMHRIVTQELRDLRPGAGRLALLLAPKGQFQALMAVFGAQEELRVLCPPRRGREVAAALGKYLRFSKSRIEEVAAGGALLLFGAGWEEVASGLGAARDRLRAGGWCTSAPADFPVGWFGETMLGFSSVFAVATDAPTAARLGDELRVAGAREVVTAVAELERIRNGWPVWGAELTATVLPPEVGIEKAAISDRKGCYVGQETIARLRSRGHVNRCLVGVRQIAGPLEGLATPLPLTHAGEGRPCGALTSFALPPHLGGVGLAVVRREVGEAGARLEGDGRSFEVTTLPLW